MLSTAPSEVTLLGTSTATRRVPAKADPYTTSTDLQKVTHNINSE